MTRHLVVFCCTVSATVLLLFSSSAHAQSGTSAAQQVVVLAPGMTAAGRDAIVRDGQRSGTFNVVFACVPAGVIVLEATTVPGPEPRMALVNAVSARVAGARMDEATSTLIHAEERCAHARNR